jgi:thiopurine S-methyltransferase
MNDFSTNQPKDWSKYWNDRWERGTTAWHQSGPEPAMVEFFKDLPPTRVLVPLCGKSQDLIWLLGQGHEVVGVELSEIACKSFFEENRISFEKTGSCCSGIFRDTRISIFNQDFFSFRAEDLGKMGAIYDRAALIALPKELRCRYAEHLIHLAKNCSDSSLSFCQLVIERSPANPEEGPPFSISQTELESLYGQAFHVEPISRQLESQGKTQTTEECVYRMTKKF